MGEDKEKNKEQDNVNVSGLIAAMKSSFETPIINLEVNNKLLSTFIDTGSVVTLISKKTSNKLGIHGESLKKNSRLLTSFSNHSVKVLGQVTLKVMLNKNESVYHDFVVVPDHYLATEILVGSDLLRRRPFQWNDVNKEVIWGDKSYDTCHSVIHSISYIKYNQVKAKRDEKDVSKNKIQLKKSITLLPGVTQEYICKIEDPVNCQTESYVLFEVVKVRNPKGIDVILCNNSLLGSDEYGQQLP